MKVIMFCLVVLTYRLPTWADTNSSDQIASTSQSQGLVLDSTLLADLRLLPYVTDSEKRLLSDLIARGHSISEQQAQALRKAAVQLAQGSSAPCSGRQPTVAEIDPLRVLFGGLCAQQGVIKTGSSGTAPSTPSSGSVR